jgi:putative membrane protein
MDFGGAAMIVSTNMLWALVALFAGATVADVLSPSLLLTVVQLCLMVAFALLHGARRYGAKGIAAFAVICLVVSNGLENIGVATGFPFGAYFYTDSLGPKLGYVPLLIGPAYLSVGYMAWTLATILVGDVKRGADKFAAFATPFIGAFIMVLWDVALDPGAATVEKRWIWEHGGGFFGVPLTNYLGWFFTVYLFMQLFAFYLRARGETASNADSKGYYFQAIAMYAIVASHFILSYLANGSETVTDATGAAWRSGDINETAAMTAIFTMLFVCALAAIKVVGESEPPRRRRTDKIPRREARPKR